MAVPPEVVLAEAQADGVALSHTDTLPDELPEKLCSMLLEADCDSVPLLEADTETEAEDEA